LLGSVTKYPQNISHWI